MPDFLPECFEDGVPMAPDLNALKIPQCLHCGMTEEWWAGCHCERNFVFPELRDDGAGQMAALRGIDSHERVTLVARFHTTPVFQLTGV